MGKKCREEAQKGAAKGKGSGNQVHVSTATSAHAQRSENVKGISGDDIPDLVDYIRDAHVVRKENANVRHLAS